MIHTLYSVYHFLELCSLCHLCTAYALVRKYPDQIPVRMRCDKLRVVVDLCGIGILLVVLLGRYPAVCCHTLSYSYGIKLCVHSPFCRDQSNVRGQLCSCYCSRHIHPPLSIIALIIFYMYVIFDL